MDALFQLLETNEIWIYIILGAVGLVYIRKLLLAWQEWRTSTFGLERENAQRRFGSYLTMVILLGLLGLAELVLVSFVSPTFPSSTALVTPTVDLLATSASTSAVEGVAMNTTQTPGSSLLGETTEVAEESLDGCIPGEIEWTDPQPGDEVKGPVELKGTIAVANLGFYKYEYSQAGSDTWTTIAAGDAPVQDGPLGGNWNTEQLLPGDYRLRLVVSDNANNTLPACGIRVRVVGP